MFLNSCLVKYRGITFEQTKEENKLEINYLTDILKTVNQKDDAYKYIAAMFFTRWVWALVASGKQSEEKFHRMMEQVWQMLMKAPKFLPFHVDRCNPDGSPYTTICNTATQLLFMITNDNEMPALEQVGLNHGLYKSLRQKYFLAPGEQPDKSHDSELGQKVPGAPAVGPGDAQGSGAAAQGSGAAAQGSGAAAPGAAPGAASSAAPKEQNRLELERINALSGPDSPVTLSQFLNDHHLGTLSGIKFIRECFNESYNFEEFQKYINEQNSHGISVEDCDKLEHGSPSWLSCQIKMAFKAVGAVGVGSVIMEVRRLLRAHMDHAGYRNRRLSILVSLNTGLSYHLNIEEMHLAETQLKKAKKAESKDIYRSLEHIRWTKLVIDNGESSTRILNHMKKLANLNPAHPTIQEYVNLAKGSVDGFVKNFNDHFNQNSEKLTQLSNETGKFSTTKGEEIRKRVKERAEAQRDAVRRVVQAAMVEFESVPPRPPPGAKRPSPEQEAASRKRQKTAALDRMREDIQRMNAVLEAQKREMEEQEARIREREARALQIEREIREMG